MTSIHSFWNREEGQDLIEYSLLMAFVALASAALFTSTGTSITSIWGNTSSRLASGALNH